MGIYQEAPNQGPQYQIHAEQVASAPVAPTPTRRDVDWGEVAVEGVNTGLWGVAGFAVGTVVGGGFGGPIGAALGVGFYQLVRHSATHSQNSEA